MQRVHGWMMRYWQLWWNHDAALGDVYAAEHANLLVLLVRPFGRTSMHHSIHLSLMGALHRISCGGESICLFALLSRGVGRRNWQCWGREDDTVLNSAAAHLDAPCHVAIVDMTERQEAGRGHVEPIVAQHGGDDDAKPAIPFSEPVLATCDNVIRDAAE